MGRESIGEVKKSQLQFSVMRALTQTLADKFRTKYSVNYIDAIQSINTSFHSDQVCSMPVD